MIDETYYDEVGIRPPRRWGRILAAIGALSIATVIGVAHSPFMAVSQVEVLGVNRSDAIARVASTGVGEGALMLYVDTGAIEETVAADPWVSDVLVSRLWPDRLVVEVLEHDPLLWIEGPTHWMLVSRTGSVLETAATPTPGLMQAALAFPDRLAGDQPVDPAWREVVDMALVLAEDIGGTMELEMRGPEMWTEVFDHPVRLGHPIDLADKARTLQAMVTRELPDGAILDVSSPLRPALVMPESPDQIEGGGEGT